MGAGPAPAYGPDPLEELGALVETAGGVVAGRAFQARMSPDPATYVGAGKADEIRRLATTARADAMVADDELASGQVRNLEKATGIRVFDRSELILDIFAVEARSREAKLQVALAQYEYRLTRLKRYWTHLDRHGGGIGLRGAGETQLEVDRREARRRIRDLHRELAHIQERRETEVAARAGAFAVALVGYTNAGKSLLMRRLTGYEARSEDRLFSTLDTRTRRARVPGVLVSDTVGFIRKLPHRLVASFRATLEEVHAADLLLHVVDASARDPDAQIAAVEEVLVEIGGVEAPVWRVWNKTDLVDGARRAGIPESDFAVSALTGEGVDRLLEAVGAESGRGGREVIVACATEDGEAMARVAAAGPVVSRAYGNGTATLRVRLGAFAERRLRRWGGSRLGFPEG